MEKSEASEDELIEILVLLPPKSVFRCMGVSRRWRALIRDPPFLHSYSTAATRRRDDGAGRLLALFQRVTYPKLKEPGKHCNTLAIAHPETIEPIPKKFGYFINSSNGLILCSHEDRRRIYHVLNPVTKIYVTLLPPRNHYLPTSTGIMCEENTNDLVPIYTIIRAGLPLSTNCGRVVYIDTYSSVSGEWSEPRQLTSSESFCLLRRPPVVANGVYHWYSTDWKLAVFDPRDGENRIQLIQLPVMTWHDSYTIWRSECDDLLWFGAMRIEKMQFYVLPKGEEGSYRREASIESEEWVLMYEMDADVIQREMRVFLASEKIVMEAMMNSPCKSEMVAVLRYGRGIYLYNLQSRSIEKLRYRGHFADWEANYLYPYIRSYFLSSYAL